jgi:hypothetical protein
MTVFMPDRADYRRPFSVERGLMQQVVALSGNGVEPGTNFNADQRFYQYWRAAIDDDASRIIADQGRRAFERAFFSALRRSKQWIQHLVEHHLREYVAALDPIDEVSSAGVRNLAAWARGDLGIYAPDARLQMDLSALCPIADSWGDDEGLIPVESLHELTLASKMVRLEAVDPWSSVTDDMGWINELSAARLWYDRKVVLTVNYCVRSQGEYQGYVHADVPITFGNDRVQTPADAGQRTLRMKCRVVVDGETTYLVMTRSRPKDLETTILKEEEPDPGDPKGSRRAARDRRGIMHVLVAVGVRGIWRVATPTDLDSFTELVKVRLWHEPLRLEDHNQWQNPETSPDFVRRKLLGRLYRKSHRDGSLPVAVSVEHQAILVTTFLSSLEAQTNLNHDIYRGQRIRRVLMPVLFSEHFERLGMTLP